MDNRNEIAKGLRKLWLQNMASRAKHPSRTQKNVSTKTRKRLDENLMKFKQKLLQLFDTLREISPTTRSSYGDEADCNRVKPQRPI